MVCKFSCSVSGQVQTKWREFPAGAPYGNWSQCQQVKGPFSEHQEAWHQFPVWRDTTEKDFYSHRRFVFIASQLHCVGSGENLASKYVSFHLKPQRSFLKRTNQENCSKKNNNTPITQQICDRSSKQPTQLWDFHDVQRNVRFTSWKCSSETDASWTWIFTDSLKHKTCFHICSRCFFSLRSQCPKSSNWAFEAVFFAIWLLFLIIPGKHTPCACCKSQTSRTIVSLANCLRALSLLQCAASASLSDVEGALVFLLWPTLASSGTKDHNWSD